MGSAQDMFALTVLNLKKDSLVLLVCLSMTRMLDSGRYVRSNTGLLYSIGNYS